MDALVDDRDVLLLARSRDLQHEYENLVRSLDAAYDAVRQINNAMAENRSEAKLVFQERLEVLALRRDVKKKDDSAVTCNNAPVDESLLINRESSSDGVTKQPRTFLRVTSTKDKVARYVIALASRKNKGAATSTAIVPAATAQNNSCSRGAACIGDATVPSLIYYPQQKQRVVTKGYVGDEHSYADVDAKAGLLDCTAVTAQEEENGEKRAETEAEVDLNIVKSELEDESNDWETKHDSVADDPFSSRDHSASDSATTLPAAANVMTTMTKTKLVQQPFEYRIQGRRKKAVESPMDEEALKRKRVMTRNRMRRWRAKKRLEQMTVKIANINKC